MKTLKIGAFAILGLLAVACSDDDENTAKLSSQEQAEMVASAMGRSGFVGSAEQSAAYADGETESGRVNLECGVDWETGLDLSGGLGDGITFMYNSDFTLLLTCDGDEPENFNVDFSYEGEYNGPRFESSYKGNGDLTVSNLSEGDHFELNGSYDRAGTFEVKEDGEVTAEGRHELNIQAEDVMIDKTNHQIKQGSASVDASGRIDGRGSYSFEADVTFEGEGSTRKAVIRVSDDTYELNIQTNSLSKRPNN